MPTSSQALIIQTTNSLLPPLFGRQKKKATLPSGPEWISTDQQIYPTANLVVLDDKHVGVDTRRHNKQRTHPPRKRTGSAPHLNYKLDFGTLTQVLSVRGIHGSMSIDHSSNSFRWKVNSIGPFYERHRRQFPKLNLSREPTRFRYTHADRMEEQYQWNDSTRDEMIDKGPASQACMEDALYNYNFRRKEPFQSELVRNVANTNGISKLRMGQRTNTHSSISNHPQTHVELEEYFKLIPAKFDNNDSTDGSLYATYELEKCSSDEAGSFRLLPTDPGDCGDFKLVPPSGFISDRFRLFTSMGNPSCFILLESDGAKSGNYRPLFKNRLNGVDQIQKEAEETEIQDKHGNVYMKHKRDVYIPREAWPDQPQVNRHEMVLINIADTECDTEQINTSTKQHVDRTENRYDYFDEITKELRRDINDFAASDINLNDDSKQFHNYKAAEGDATPKENANVSNHHKYHFESTHTRANSKTNSSLYTSIGTHAEGSLDTRNVDERFDIANINTEERIQYSEWSVHDFDQWSRTRSKQTHQEQLLPVIPIQSSQSPLTQNRRSIDEDTMAKSNAVLNDVKFKASYKLWKKKKISTLRMRKELPKSDPYAVCVKVDDGNMAHDQMKHSVEKEIGCKLVSLQFDPVLINSFQGESKYRWILRFSNPSICEALSLRGIHVDGVKRSVRRYDDVMREEYDAYMFYETMKDMESKLVQKNAKKTLPKLSVTNTTEAQTATM